MALAAETQLNQAFTNSRNLTPRQDSTPGHILGKHRATTGDAVTTHAKGAKPVFATALLHLHAKARLICDTG